MSITRRAFIQRALSVTSAALTSCTLPALDGQAPVVIATPTVTIWTTSYVIDDALARWRGAHPRIPVTRKVVAPAALNQWITESIRGERSAPDIVIADATTIAAWNSQRYWRQQLISQTTDRQHMRIGLQHCTDAAQSRFAIPLTVNPLGVWYDRGVLGSVLTQPDPLQVSDAFGTTFQSFVSFLNEVADSLPYGPVLSSLVDDVLIPQLERSSMTGDTYDASWEQTVAAVVTTAASLQWAAPERHFSGPWYQRISHQQTGMIVAGRWMQAALMRAINDSPSMWRLCAPAGGYIAGPSLVAAVPEVSPQPESATTLATDMANDVELQHLLAGASGTIPSLRAAQSAAPFVGTDAFCGGQQIGNTWCEAAESLTTAPHTAERIAHRQEIQARFIQTFTR